MSYIGTTKIGKLYLGTTSIAKAYLGSQLVFQLDTVPIQTFSAHVTGYDTTNSVYNGWLRSAPADRGYTDADSATDARAQWKNGSQAITTLYWTFNLSALPVNAVIVGVSVQAKARLTTTSYQTGRSYMCLCNGTTEVGAHTEVHSTTERIYTLDGGTGWTRSSLQNACVLFRTQRGTSNTSAAYYQCFYGATITIRYKELNV